jgi:hypothetical protein
MVRHPHQARQLAIQKRHDSRARRVRSIPVRAGEHGYVFPLIIDYPLLLPSTSRPHHTPMLTPLAALFLSSMAYLEGSSVRQRLSDAYVPGLTKNFMVWPWVQFTNFKYVPMEHRVLVVNIISLGWNCYLSALNSGGSPAVKEVGKEGGELPPS